MCVKNTSGKSKIGHRRKRREKRTENKYENAYENVYENIYEKHKKSEKGEKMCRSGRREHWSRRPPHDTIMSSTAPGRIEVTCLQSSPSLAERRKEIAGNTNTGLIKVIAVFFMLIDHAAILFFQNATFYTEMRLLGRIAMPLFCWGCAVGCVYTHNIPIYGLRVLLAGILIQLPYMPVMGHDWTYLNVFFPLSLGIFAVGGIRLGKGALRVLIPVACLLIPDAVQALFGAKMDYSWKGALLVICLYLCRGDRKLLATVFFVFCLFWGASSQKITSFLGFSFSFVTDRFSVIADILRLQAWAILALPLILISPRYGFKVPKWVSYLIYPAHLLLLWGIGRVVG